MDNKSDEKPTPEQHALLEAVRNSAQQIWQAGLGAFSKAQQDGSALFDKLVRDGSELHRLTQFLPDGGAAMADKVSSFAGNVGKQATGSWDKLEKIFEDRVARALRSLGVPSQEDLERLRAEIAVLKAALADTAPAPRAQRKAPAKRAAKAAAKSATRGTLPGAAKTPKKAVAKPRQARARSSTH